MLWQRLLFGSLMIAALGGLVAADGVLSAGAPPGPVGVSAISPAQAVRCGLAVTVLVVLLVVPGAYELGRLCRAGGYNPLGHWAAFVSAGLAVLPWIEMQKRLMPVGGFAAAMPGELPLLWLAGGVLGASLGVLGRKTTERAAANMALTLFVACYLGLLGSFVVRIRCLWPGPAGAALVVYVILTVKAGDIGAYFTGSLVGRHKLVPWLSPGKTLEGAVGALALASAVAVGGMALWPRLGTGVDPPFQYAQALVFGLAMAVSGHIGDLVASAMKRDMGAKDSGRAVPAFGGLVDIVDSPLFAAPVAWWMLTFWAEMG